MKGKLIIHIGPPKTGTTSLQYWLQSLNFSEIKYEGCFQPRKEKNNNSLANRIYRYCSNTDSTIKQEEIRNIIAEKLNKYEYLIISEESFVLDTLGSSWQEKLERLYNISKEFNPTIIFFERDISKVIPSFYQEIYISLDSKLQENFSAFEESNHSKVYDYKYLYRELLRIGFGNVKCFHFDKFIKGEYKLANIINNYSNDYNLNIEPPLQNKGTLKQGKRLLEKKHFIERYLYNLGRFIPSNLQGKGIFSPIIRLLRVVGRKKVTLKVSKNTLKTYQESLEFLQQNIDE